MKKTYQYTTIVKCDVLNRSETPEEVIDNDVCEEMFYTASISRMARIQAADAKWLRVKVKLVRWPGLPPMADGKKVDVCPKHASLVMTLDEYKIARRAAREVAKAEKKATRAAERRAEREVAKAAKAAKAAIKAAAT